MKLKLLLLKNRLKYLAYCAVMLLIAYIADRFVQMLIFILFFNFIQSCFTERFHAEYVVKSSYDKATLVCKIITTVVELLYLACCGKLNVSIYYHLLIIFIVALLNYLIGHIIKELVYEELKYCDYNTLKIMCEKAGLSHQATERMIKHYVDKKTIREIASDECIEIQSVKIDINRSKKKINNYYTSKS